MSGFAAQWIGARLGRYRRRLARPVGRAVTVALTALSCGALVTTAADAGWTVEVWAAIGLQAGLAAATWRPWRAPEDARTVLLTGSPPDLVQDATMGV